jgi:hypothetical protein
MSCAHYWHLSEGELLTDGLTTSAHSLRYVLKNRVTNEPLFVVIFSLLPKDGEQKCEEPAAAAAAAGEKPVQSTKDDDLD